MSLQVFKAFHMSVKTSTIQKQKQKSSPVKRCQKPQKNKSLHLTAEANVYDLSKPAAWKVQGYMPKIAIIRKEH